MERIKKMTYKEKSILHLDLTNFDVSAKEELGKAIAEMQDYIAKEPFGSLLVITDITKLRFDMDIIKMFIRFTSHNKPYVKASAVIGIAGLLNIALNSMMKSAVRDIHTFNSEAEALDWLVEQ